MSEAFSEAFYGYHLAADGTHNGRSFPIKTKEALRTYISNWIERYPEIRITDSGDALVMHIINQRVVFPPREDGAVVVWDPARKDFTIEVPTQLRGRVCRFYACIRCKKPFSNLNVKTSAGWAETQITGWCELCWDEIMSPSDDDEDPGFESADPDVGDGENVW